MDLICPTMCGIMKKRIRHYISVYFEDGLVDQRKKRDVTVSFSENDDLYELCKNLGASEIKRIIGFDSYSELVKRAKEEDRSIGNYIKHKLRVILKDEQKNTSS